MGHEDCGTNPGFCVNTLALAIRDGVAESGYTECLCCGDVTVSSDVTRPELCELCEEAGCDCRETSDGLMWDCARTDFDVDES